MFSEFTQINGGSFCCKHLFCHARWESGHMRPRPQGLNTGLQTNDDAHFCCLQTSNGVCSTQTYISSTQNTKLLNNRHSLTLSWRRQSALMKLLTSRVLCSLKRWRCDLTHTRSHIPHAQHTDGQSEAPTPPGLEGRPPLG